MKKESLPELSPTEKAAGSTRPMFGDRYEHMAENFLDDANQLLRERINPIIHEQTRSLQHEGYPCVLRHLVDSHLASMETDPVGLKLFVGTKGSDRHAFETRIHNRDFIKPIYFAVIADPSLKTISIEYYRGDQKDEKIHYYEKPLAQFDINRVKLGLLKFSELLP